MTQPRPKPLDVTVHVAGKDGKLQGTPLPIAKPGEVNEDRLIASRINEVPDFSQAEHDRLFQKRLVNGVPHWTAPHQLTARQILASHQVENEDYFGRQHMYVTKMTDMMKGKYGGLDTGQQMAWNEDTKISDYTNLGGGTGATVDENITKNGYDWNKPIVVSTNGGGTTTGPQIINGNHRLMWMFTHHPDVPIPIETHIRRAAFVNPKTRHALSDAAYDPSEKNLTKLRDEEQGNITTMKENWLNEMAQANPKKYGSLSTN
jgi:hypothetical protein